MNPRIKVFKPKVAGPVLSDNQQARCQVDQGDYRWASLCEEPNLNISNAVVTRSDQIANEKCLLFLGLAERHLSGALILYGQDV